MVQEHQNFEEKSGVVGVCSSSDARSSTVPLTRVPDGIVGVKNVQHLAGMMARGSSLSSQALECIDTTDLNLCEVASSSQKYYS